MTSMYPLYSYRNHTKESHNLLGALILFGGLIFIIGMLVLHLEIAVLGSGMMLFGALGTVCCMDQDYHRQRYEDASTEEGIQDDDDSE